MMQAPAVVGDTPIVVETLEPAMVRSLYCALQHPAVRRVIERIISGIEAHGLVLDAAAAKAEVRALRAKKDQRTLPTKAGLRQIDVVLQQIVRRVGHAVVAEFMAYGVVCIAMGTHSPMPVVLNIGESAVTLYRFLDPQYGMRYYAVRNAMQAFGGATVVGTFHASTLKTAREAANACDKVCRVYVRRDWRVGRQIPDTELVALLPMLNASVVVHDAHTAAWVRSTAPPLFVTTDGQYGRPIPRMVEQDVFAAADTLAAQNELHRAAQDAQGRATMAKMGVTPGGDDDARAKQQPAMPLYTNAEQPGTRRCAEFGDFAIRRVYGGTNVAAPVNITVPNGYVQYDDRIRDAVATGLRMPEDANGMSSAARRNMGQSNTMPIATVGTRTEQDATMSEYGTGLCALLGCELSLMFDFPLTIRYVNLTLHSAMELYEAGFLTAEATRMILGQRLGIADEDIPREPLPPALVMRHDDTRATIRTKRDIAELAADARVEVAKDHDATLQHVAEEKAAATRYAAKVAANAKVEVAEMHKSDDDDANAADSSTHASKRVASDSV